MELFGALPAERKEIENKKIELEINDVRNTSIQSKFNLDEFLSDLNILMTDESLLKTRENRYGKYFRFATAESDGLTESLRNAKAVRITITNGGILYEKLGKDRTRVTIDSINGENEGRRTELVFDEEGKYRQGSLTRRMEARTKIEHSIDAEWELTDNSEI